MSRQSRESLRESIDADYERKAKVRRTAALLLYGLPPGILRVEVSRWLREHGVTVGVLHPPAETNTGEVAAKLEVATGKVEEVVAELDGKWMAGRKVTVLRT